MLERTSTRRRNRTYTAFVCARVGHCAALGLLLIVSAGAHAATVYQCQDAAGHAAFQDTPCVGSAHQTRENVVGQPLIDPSAPHALTMDAHPPRAAARRVTRTVRQHEKPAMAWECRAADGEVFYRHTRCPGSVPGDGVVRDRYNAATTRPSSRRRRTAWSPVRVHGVKVTRAEACAAINGVAAGGRDGHERDANVSVYAHLMGRDPCAGY